MNRKRQNVIGGVCVVLAIGIITMVGQLRNCNIKKNGAYVIGIVNDYTPSGNGVGMHYIYNYNNNQYESVATISYMMRDERPKDTRLFLICEKQNPQMVLVIDVVPSWFTLDAPPDGWATMPTEVEMREMMVQDSIKRRLK